MLTDFHIGFDPVSLEKLVRLAGFEALMMPEVTAMLTATGQLLVTAAQTNTWQVFDNPTGVLADSIYFYVVSPTEVDLAVGVIYGRRRELGGGGLLDSLGRQMNDRARPYLQPAIDDSQDLIRTIMEESVMTALGGII
jgi:hypothetical protein